MGVVALSQGVRFSAPTLKRKEIKMEKSNEMLTKAWKEGRLKPGFYYVRYSYGNIGMEYAGKWYGKDGHLKRIGFDDDEIIKEVLELVPSYDIYRRMEALIHNGESAIETNRCLCEKLEELRDTVNRIFDGVRESEE